MNEDIINQIRKERKEENKNLQFDLFSRIAYILSSSSEPEKIEKLDSSSMENVVNKRVKNLDTSVKRICKVKIPPFYLPTIENLGDVLELKKTLTGNEYAEFCYDKSDFNEAIFLKRWGLKVDQALLNNFRLKTVANYYLAKELLPKKESARQELTAEIEEAKKNLISKVRDVVYSTMKRKLPLLEADVSNVKNVDELKEVLSQALFNLKQRIEMDYKSKVMGPTKETFIEESKNLDTLLDSELKEGDYVFIPKEYPRTAFAIKDNEGYIRQIKRGIFGGIKRVKVSFSGGNEIELKPKNVIKAASPFLREKIAKVLRKEGHSIDDYEISNELKNGIIGRLIAWFNSKTIGPVDHYSLFYDAMSLKSTIKKYNGKIKRKIKEGIRQGNFEQFCRNYNIEQGALMDLFSASRRNLFVVTEIISQRDIYNSKINKLECKLTDLNNEINPIKKFISKIEADEYEVDRGSDGGSRVWV